MDDRRRQAAEALRESLVDRLVATGTVRSARVERALRTVPRERFVPDLDVLEVYDDRAQLVKEDRSGPLSTISQPTMVAIMLELADVAAGDRVLEIGTGTGYNAALLAELVGDDGSVASVDVEEDLVRDAAATLADLGYDRVRVRAGDGREGWADAAPFDVVMATVGVPEVPRAWRDQLAEGGRLLAPLLDEREVRVEQRRGDRFETVARSPAVFIPIR